MRISCAYAEGYLHQEDVASEIAAATANTIDICIVSKKNVQSILCIKYNVGGLDQIGISIKSKLWTPLTDYVSQPMHTIISQIVFIILPLRALRTRRGDCSLIEFLRKLGVFCCCGGWGWGGEGGYCICGFALVFYGAQLRAIHFVINRCLRMPYIFLFVPYVLYTVLAFWSTKYHECAFARKLRSAACFLPFRHLREHCGRAR